MAAILAVYEGIKSQVDANQDVTVTLAGNAITFVPIYLDKKDAFLEKIQKIVQKYIEASLDFSDANAPAKAAYYNEKKSIVSSEMDSETGQINALIENFKSQAQMDESDLQNAISMQIPENGYLKSLVDLIARWPG